MSQRVLVQNQPWITIGRLIAALVLIIDIVFLATSTIDLRIGLLIAGLAIAELVP